MPKRLIETRTFWRFVVERQKIWHRRFVLQESAPWTKDKVLARYHFTNVYRELDRGTIWYLENVVPQFPLGNARLVQAIWKTLAYRLLNNVDVWAVLDLPEMSRWASRFYQEEFADRLRCLKREMHTIYSPAYITLQCHRPTDRITNFIDFLDSAF